MWSFLQLSYNPLLRLAACEWRQTDGAHLARWTGNDEENSYSTTNKMHLLSQIIYSCKTLYMFRTIFPSIIRSSKLRIQQPDNVTQLLLPAAIGDETRVPSHSR